MVIKEGGVHMQGYNHNQGYLSDILDQPESLRKALPVYLGPEYLERMVDLARLKFDRIIFSGMGSSNFCSLGASILLNSGGYSSEVKSAGHLLHYDMEQAGKGTLLFLISQSGESIEITNILDRLPEGSVVAAITNNPSSTLAKRADLTFNLNVAAEESVTTRTYLASLLLVDIIAKTISGQRDEEFTAQVWDTLSYMEEYLKNYNYSIAQMKNFMALPPYLCLAGRGYSLSTVRAGALFFREVAKYPAIDFDSGEFKHGPVEMVDENFC